MLKQALKGSSPNLTPSHMTTMSLCGLESAKRVDREFLVPYKSSVHTERDAQGDIIKMAHHLVEEKVANMNREEESTEFNFSNPFHKGAEKIASGYIEKYL